MKTKKQKRKFMKQKLVLEKINKIDKPLAKLTKKGTENISYQDQE